jgi:membrane-associated PAP2 superfamily phosphatase
VKAGATGGVAAGRADWAVTLAALAALLAWDTSGADLAVTRLFASPQGFALRDSVWTATLLHGGGRLLAWALMLALLVAALRAPAARTPGTPGRAERWRWLGVVLLCALLVPMLKRVSATSCPWDLAEFGGTALYVSHWALGQFDGGPGHCFPSGHAVAAFAFFGLYFQWRGHDPRRARRWLLLVLAAGLLFGAAQLLRGAHHLSHTLWSAWLCWAIGAAADALWQQRAPAPG